MTFGPSDHADTIGIHTKIPIVLEMTHERVHTCPHGKQNDTTQKHANKHRTHEIEKNVDVVKRNQHVVLIL